MTFELLPTAIYWLVAFAAVAAAGVVLMVGLAVDSVARNHRIRVSQDESIRSYYGRLPLTH